MVICMNLKKYSTKVGANTLSDLNLFIESPDIFIGQTLYRISLVIATPRFAPLFG